MTPVEASTPVRPTSIQVRHLVFSLLSELLKIILNVWFLAISLIDDIDMVVTVKFMLTSMNITSYCSEATFSSLLLPRVDCPTQLIFLYLRLSISVHQPKT